MIKGKELSTKEFESIEIELNKILGSGSLESISLKYKPIDCQRTIYNKSKYLFDTELFVELIHEDALECGLKLTAVDEHILVFDECDSSNYKIEVSNLSIEEACGLPILALIATNKIYSLPEYANKIHDAYHEYFDRQLNRNTEKE
ncbi:hypothetical protein [Ekhidna sp.]|uniref:hypothetical protein n=1 Tax=Ekhidna sp. TaxID=2608089 RepID=UPI003297E3C9